MTKVTSVKPNIVITGYQPTGPQALELQHPPRGGSNVAAQPSIANPLGDLLADVGQYLYETVGNFPTADAPEIQFVARIEEFLDCKFTLPDRPRPMSPAQHYAQVCQALVALVNCFPVTKDTLRVLFGDGEDLDETARAQATALQDAMVALFNAGRAEEPRLDLESRWLTEHSA